MANSERSSWMFFRSRVIRFALKRMLIGGQRQRIPYFALTLVYLFWGNLFYAASWFYLRRVALHVLQSRGSVLECGSGATTLIVSALTAAKNRRVQILEHDAEWFEQIRDMLHTAGITHIELVHAPLRSYGIYTWYGPPQDFAYADDIGLVICDGPPGSTVGGRYGMLPVLKPYLSPGCTILLDDTHRSGEKRVIRLWRRLAPFDCRHRKGLIGNSSELRLH